MQPILALGVNRVATELAKDLGRAVRGEGERFGGAINVNIVGVRGTKRRQDADRHWLRGLDRAPESDLHLLKTGNRRNPTRR